MRVPRTLLPLLGALTLVSTFAAVAAPAGKNGSQATVAITTNGEAVNQVASGQQFAVSGTGYRPGLPVLVCFSDRYCRHTDVDDDGEFYDVRTIYEAGTYLVTVKQARNQQLERWDLKARTSLVVTP